jgi:L-histidine N-alpha-methyltransferase
MPAVLPVPCLPEAASTPLGAEVYRGLTAFPKRLSPWLFYDPRGSELFEAITELPEYYLTRTERAIFAANADSILEAAGTKKLAILELGAGTAAKTGVLLAAAARKQGKVAYYPIDISAPALRVAQERLGAEMPEVSVKPILGDYTAELDDLPMPSCRRLVLYIGSSIGNFDPREATGLLRQLRRRLSAGDWLLLGVDHVKDRTTLLRAYNDIAGVTAEFNRNVLERIKRELGGTWRPGLFRHRAWWNDQVARMEMHLESLVAQEIAIPALDLKVSFRRGETIHTENSYKFTPETAGALLQRGGFAVRQSWTDEKRWFGVYLAEAA